MLEVNYDPSVKGVIGLLCWKLNVILDELSSVELD